MKKYHIVIGMTLMLLGSFMFGCENVNASDYSGYISNVTPSSFTGGVETTVYVTVYNTGDSGTLIVDPVSDPPGWDVDGDNIFNTVKKYVASGSSETFPFSVTPPEEGGSGTITWELLYDGTWSNTFLHSYPQDVSAEAGEPPYSGSITMVSPSSFIGGVETTVYVTVYNTGDSGTLIVDPVSDPPGWDVDGDNIFNTVKKYVASGSSETFPFSVTPPEEGGSGTITWELLYDGTWSNTFLHSYPQDVYAESGLPVYKGSITSVSPSSFTGGKKTQVSVSVNNNGDSGTLIVLPEEVPEGWLVDDGVIDGNVDIQQSVGSGFSETFTFYITPPFEGGSGTITWALYYDNQWPKNNNKLGTKSQSVSADRVVFNYNSQDSDIGFKIDFSSNAIPVEGDLSFPIYIGSVSTVNPGDTIEIDTKFTNKPLTVTVTLPASVSKITNYLDSLGTYIIEELTDGILDLVFDSYNNKVTKEYSNPMGDHIYPIYEKPGDFLVASYSFNVYFGLIGDVIGKLFVDGPVDLDKELISFYNNEKIVFHVDATANPGEIIKIGVVPIYDASAYLSAQFKGNLLGGYAGSFDSGEVRLLPEDPNDYFDYQFPPDDTLGFICTVNYPPLADFKLPNNPTALYNLDFSDLSSDEDGSIVSWSWGFGDGTTSSLQNPTHKYTTYGEYFVNLTVKDDAGAFHYMNKNISIGRSPIEITSHSDLEIIKGNTILSGNTYVTGGLIGSIESVEVRIDKNALWEITKGTNPWTYEINTNDLENGFYTFYIRCSDGNKYSEVLSITLEVKNSQSGLRGITSDDDSVPGFELIVAICAIALVLFRKRKRIIIL